MELLLQRILGRKEKKPLLIREETRDTWEAIRQQVQIQMQKGEGWINQALKQANKPCFSLLKPEGPLRDLGFEETTEWQVFYTFLLERFVRTDEGFIESTWKWISTIIRSVRSELLKAKEFPIPRNKAKAWLGKVDNAARMIVATQRKKDKSLPEKKFSQIAALAGKFGQELAEIRRK